MYPCFAELRYADQRNVRRDASATRNACAGYTRNLALCLDAPLGISKPITSASADSVLSVTTPKCSRSARGITERAGMRGMYSGVSFGRTTALTETNYSRTTKPSTTHEFPCERNRAGFHSIIPGPVFFTNSFTGLDPVDNQINEKESVL